MYNTFTFQGFSHVTAPKETTFKSFEVVPRCMRLLKRAFQKKLDAIESQLPVEIVWGGESTKVVIKHRPVCSDRQYQEGVDRFMALYQLLYVRMYHVVVELDTVDDVRIQKAVNQVMEVYPVLIERTGDKWSIYGEGSFTARTVATLKEKLGVTVENMRRFGSQWADLANTRPDADVKQPPGLAQSSEGKSFAKQFKQASLSCVQLGTKVLRKMLRTGLLLANRLFVHNSKPPFAPFNVEQNVLAGSNIVWGGGGLVDGFGSLFTDI